MEIAPLLSCPERSSRILSGHSWLLHTAHRRGEMSSGDRFLPGKRDVSFAGASTKIVLFFSSYSVAGQ